jgi:hypothetical protein
MVRWTDFVFNSGIQDLNRRNVLVIFFSILIVLRGDRHGSS